MSSGTAKNPTGGAAPRHVMERHSIDLISVEYVVVPCEWDSLSGYGPMISANRPLRTRTMGGVGRDG